MRSSRLVAVLTLAVIGALALPGLGTAAPTILTATLTGENEVNGNGDPNQGDLDGDGTAEITLKQRRGKVCFDIAVTNIQLPAQAAHIHQGPAGQNGPIKVTLTPPGADGHSSGCVRTGRALIRMIKANPSDYYVNVHTGDFPNGALRGQLA
jgi:hypothetical protein